MACQSISVTRFTLSLFCFTSETEQIEQRLVDLIIVFRNISSLRHRKNYLRRRGPIRFTMGTKADAPKLSPAERLARKRAAARLRQQRCRARKRQAMLEKKRGEIVRQRCVKLTHDPSRSAVVMRAVQHRPQTLYPTYKPMHAAEASVSPWPAVRGKGPARPSLQKSPSEPIYNCVSFDSQKSMEEAQQNASRVSSSPPRSPSQKSPIVVTPTARTPPLPPSGKKVAKVLSEEKVEDSLVREEEAAVFAMLSLKSGSTSPSEKSEKEIKQPPASPSNSPPREVMISNKPTTTASSPGPRAMNLEQMPHRQQVPHRQPNPSHTIRPPQQRRMVPRLYETYSYGQPMKIPPHSRRVQVPPGYYRVHAPVPPPHSHYARCYYPPAPRFVAYDYE